MKRMLLILLLTGAVGCKAPPPNLTPLAQQAYQNAQIQQPLDLIRDTVQNGTATVPPVFSTSSARIVTQAHKDAITFVHDRAAGWQANVKKVLDQMISDLPAADAKKVQPYVTLAETVIGAIS